MIEIKDEKQINNCSCKINKIMLAEGVSTL